MSSERQIAANRLNAQRSTGPRTRRGQLRVRRNAFKHGLTARAVVSVLEDDHEFRDFAQRIGATYRPVTPVHSELVRRLTGILWRLRRAHAVETGLLDIQARLQRDIRVSRPAAERQSDMLELLGLRSGQTNDPQLDQARQETEAKARAFLRLCNINGNVFDLLNRYEVSLWRQAVQLIMMLERAENPMPSASLAIAKRTQ
jgi:hypothetical protein